MRNPRKLNLGEIRLIQIIHRDKNESGWTLTSTPILSLVRNLPQELIEIRETSSLNFVRLTPKGQQVYDVKNYYI